MNKQLIVMGVLCLLFTHFSLYAQSLHNSVRGKVMDQDAKIPLVGANVIIIAGEKEKGASTDGNGEFAIDEVPIGRINILLSYLGYEEVFIGDVLLNSGKELVLELEMAESIHFLEEVVVKANDSRQRPINEMASVSARSFSVEESGRYAASFFDPARMALNYAGVTSAGGEGDILNEIIVRGNSPKGIAWHLEGIEIPNPNHFGGQGNSGGGISMLSSSTLSNSDFYTGAFPAEYGNAVSGLFDLKMRNGNNEQAEYSLMLGLLGIEAAAEGPFSKDSKSSYLINYRYSTLSALDKLGVSPIGDVVPVYQDLSFKFNFPTSNFGTFALFGLGGTNSNGMVPDADTSLWESDDDKWGFDEKQRTGTIGLSHRILFENNSYLHTVAAVSVDNYDYDDYYLDKSQELIEVPDEIGDFRNNIIRVSTKYTRKINAKNTYRIGAIISAYQSSYDLREQNDGNWESYLDSDANSSMIQFFGHWKWKLNSGVNVNGGLHYTRFNLNGHSSLEPRLAVQWDIGDRDQIALSAGIHSRPEHLSFYFVEDPNQGENNRYPNKNLDFTKSAQTVLAYDKLFRNKIHLKTEVYFQKLYDVPVVDDENSTESIINAQDIWDIAGAGIATNKGTGKNYGVDLTLERSFTNQFYFLFSGSLYDSKYTAANGIEYNSRYNGGYSSRMLVGKEYKVGKKQNNILSVNAKFILMGGNRYTPIDIDQSLADQETILIDELTFTEQTPAYWRTDVGVSIRFNREKSTHGLFLEIQNVTNRENIFTQYFNTESNQIDYYYQTGLLPNLNYRIEF